MTNYNHPITPPPEFVEQWDSECESDVDAAMYLATQAARWGADQELAACCEWLDIPNNRHGSGDGWLISMRLHAARRPKPPSWRVQMFDLSPAAYAVLTAVTLKKYDMPLEGLPAFAEEMEPLIAAALRAAADQVVPPALEEEFIDRNQALPLTKMVEIRRKLLAIAAELEAQ